MGDKTKVQVSKLKPGRYIIIDGEPCRIVNVTVSSPGKHGSAKARIEAVGIFDGKVRSIVKPTSAEVDVPIIDKRVGQIIAITPDTVQLMDMETYETFDVPIEGGVDDEVKGQLTEGITVEYWETLGRIQIKKIRGE
ncbi:translation initiation factor eIF-5A [Thermococcus kodakarensis KOD1]|uniref:Translation initiation factor 5A n=1 Tax=Thermococcus kodakarensis (strain ATCC BAA-918 / JCM 12380 / KOD1) TaxID=69014 RepID=IF5A_THEKO|nr:translation initiation factor IF-5A [Thermococcus kodakarensis]Q5JI42.1 RecName: Full=Translation initiation factor 5A; AltName: Full=Hypusine-containing protein; AltName: Full=eIF-5A [Thermococcus kodakarensis KOD1]WCN28873.1 translation initiation factor IF-5A [Thermococcus kodakarensis]WCN31176.1 translation initiation factor IF-5A [Thermococcus kodakarensis]BAD85067.1 translation initiation factor eIF-5A [Thermococcus kodakarensis KOD1]